MITGTELEQQYEKIRKFIKDDEALKEPDVVHLAQKSATEMLIAMALVGIQQQLERIGNQIRDLKLPGGSDKPDLWPPPGR